MTCHFVPACTIFLVGRLVGMRETKMQAVELNDEMEAEGGHSLRQNVQNVTTWDCLAQPKHCIRLHPRCNGMPPCFRVPPTSRARLVGRGGGFESQFGSRYV